MTRRIQACVCGGGSLAHALVGVLGANEAVEVRLLTRQPQRWQQTVQVVYRREAQLLGHLDRVSSDPADVIPGADVVFLTVPAFARTDVLNAIRPFVERSAWVGSLPGGGGFEWLARQRLGDSARIFGLQRAPYVCRTSVYGAAVHVTGIRSAIHLAALPGALVEQAARLVRRALNIPVVSLENFLCVTLAPANPIFHPPRLYGLFRDWTDGVTYPRNILFYEEWDDLASQLYLACDKEVQSICAALPIDLTCVRPILEHYQLQAPENLTVRIRTIEPLHGIRAPLFETSAGYVPDLDSRFFQEDIPYGMVVIRAVAEVAGVATPVMDEIISWTQKLLGNLYLVDGSITGPGSRQLPIPQNFGLASVKELATFAAS